MNCTKRITTLARPTYFISKTFAMIIDKLKDNSLDTVDPGHSEATGHYTSLIGDFARKIKDIR